MADHVAYAFLPRIDAVSKPTVVVSLDRLARLIHQRRGDRPIQLEEIDDLHARRRMAAGEGPEVPAGRRDRGVQVWTLLPDGGRDRCLGFAWLDGAGREALQAALTRAALTPGRPHPWAQAA